MFYKKDAAQRKEQNIVFFMEIENVGDFPIEYTSRSP